MQECSSKALAATGKYLTYSIKKINYIWPNNQLIITESPNLKSILFSFIVFIFDSFHEMMYINFISHWFDKVHDTNWFPNLPAVNLSKWEICGKMLGILLCRENLIRNIFNSTLCWLHFKLTTPVQRTVSLLWYQLVSVGILNAKVQIYSPIIWRYTWR